MISVIFLSALLVYTFPLFLKGEVVYKLACFPPEHTENKNAVLQRFFLFTKRVAPFLSLFLPTAFTFYA